MLFLWITVIVPSRVDLLPLGLAENKLFPEPGGGGGGGSSACIELHGEAPPPRKGLLEFKHWKGYFENSQSEAQTTNLKKSNIWQEHFRISRQTFRFVVIWLDHI